MPFLLSVQRGLALALPLIMIGALALLLLNFPLPALQRTMDAALGESWRAACESLISGSVGIASLAVVCTFSGVMTAIHNQRHADQFVGPTMASVVVLSCFFVVTAPSVTSSWQTVFSIDRGLFVALCVAAAASKLYLALARLGPLQLPLAATGSDSVVREVLTIMPAGMATIIVFGVIRMLLVSWGITDLHGAARHILAAPFSGARDSLGFGAAFSGLCQLLWFFGVHGPNLLFSVEENILVPAGIANAAAIFTGNAPPYIFTKAFFDAFTRMGGSGCTLCLILAILWRSRDGGSRKLCLFALLPALCNVNEPLLFGIPMVLNPLYFMPFLLTPIVQTAAAYSATVLGLVPHTGAGATWTTPALLSGYAATGSMAGAVMQMVNLLLGAAMYAPFVRLSDRLGERQGRRLLRSLLDAACSSVLGPGGRKCLDRPGGEGRIAKLLANDLLKALAEDKQLFLEYQPQIDAVNGRVHGVEALLRWRHPVYGMIAPPIAVALAEDMQCINQLGLFVLTEACAQRAAWRGAVPETLTMSVNVVPQQILDPLFTQKVMDALEDAELPSELLEIEITESTVLEPDEKAMATLRRLREAGVRVAIDDFGMGHTSLRYLREFPVDTVKIDRSLTLGGPGGVNDHIVRSIVGLTRTLGISTVVEGVETLGQIEHFRTLGCGTFQGYFFSRPVDGEKCLKFILQWDCKEEVA
jgi:lactose/cellobiose-specific phosphotransferase system IIC component